MRRRLVLSTLAVVVVVMAVLLAPVALVVNAAADPDEQNGLFARIAVIAVFALAAAAALSAVQARQLARPLERLARSAGRVGDGDFSTPAQPSGIDEIDDIARSLRLSANRVDRMLEAERGFTADATHQLRTGLTGLAIRLELLERHHDPEVAAEAAAILEQTHELNSTLDELLAVARKGSTGERAVVQLVEIVDDHIDDWRVRFDRLRRQVVVTTSVTAPVRATRGLVGQIVDILLDNALRHGAGTVMVLVEKGSITVSDEGAGIRDEAAGSLFERPTDHQAAHGRGLALARRLAESDGGRLELAERRPACFRLTYVPADA
ncbi:MAG: sensor histidine kinase [Ilumatobacter sp.]|uniref:sensor histidine kinase n=1 Tax=Ilumatobacter sp. TaxID=1967498 RepID=UPI003919799D